MQDTEIIALWKSVDKKLGEQLLLNKKNAEDLGKIKVRSLLSSMTPLKVFTLLVGILWVGIIDVIIFNLFYVASPFFIVSAVIQVLLTKIAIAVYFYQLVLIYQAGINDPVVETQEKLARLKTSTLWVTKILFLQFPVWTTFYLTGNMLRNADPWLLLVQIAITLGFTVIAAWFFINIRYENRDKKWFRLIFAGKEWDPVLRSMDLLQQVEELRQERNAGDAGA